MEINTNLSMTDLESIQRHKNIEEFENALTVLINKYSMENLCDTPDYILAQFLVTCLQNYSHAVNRRDNWYGFKPFDSKIINKPESGGGNNDE